ncbi:MAG: Crp/Fnr family transcriptional regulator [Salibacteraceae bacterium]
MEAPQAMAPLFDYLNAIAELSQEERDYLLAHAEVIEVAKGEYLLEAEKCSKDFYFVIQGAVRMYYPVEGEEKTAFFYLENSFISSYESFLKQTPARHGFQCLENCRLVAISRAVTFEILDRFPKFDLLTWSIQTEELIMYQNLVATFITLSPEQRYLHLLQEHPDWLQRINLHHLAGYLGVTPETLSRIRHRVALR